MTDPYDKLFEYASRETWTLIGHVAAYGVVLTAVAITFLDRRILTYGLIFATAAAVLLATVDADPGFGALLSLVVSAGALFIVYEKRHWVSAAARAWRLQYHHPNIAIPKPPRFKREPEGLDAYENLLDYVEEYGELPSAPKVARRLEDDLPADELVRDIAQKLKEKRGPQ